MRERRGDYLGKTVQVVPHVTDEIQVRHLCLSYLAIVHTKTYDWRIRDAYFRKSHDPVVSSP